MRVRLTLNDLSGVLTAPKPRPPGPSARERAEANWLSVLRAIAAHGHLRVSDIAAACWPSACYAVQMAQRTVKRLCDEGLLLGRHNAHGGTSYVLTRPGARYLEVRGSAARHGLDLASVAGSTFAHHALTSRWCIEKRRQGFETYTEYAIRTGQAPVAAEVLSERFGKLPDALLIQDERAWWVETEMAPKATEELHRIVGLADRLPRQLCTQTPHGLVGLVVVFDAELNHGKRIARVAHERWHALHRTERRSRAERVTLSQVALGRPLVWRGCTDERLVVV